MKTCPLCNRPLDDNWSEIRQQTLASGTPLVQPGTVWEKKTPTRSPQINSDVIVPVLQSFITGIVGVIIGRAIANWTAAIITGGIVFSIVWMFKLWDHRDLLYTIETVTGLDIDKDGYKGKPSEPETVQIELHEHRTNGQSISWLELPIDQDKLALLARSVINGNRSLAESQWTGKSGPFSIDEFRELRDTFIEKGLARWRNPEYPRQGWELTKKGLAVFQQLAGL